MGFSANKIINALKNILLHGQIRRGTGNQKPFPHSGKSQVTIGILERTVFTILVRIPLEKQFDPLGPIASRGRFVRSAVKYADDKNF